jgi:hypothetical protein
MAKNSTNLAAESSSAFSRASFSDFSGSFKSKLVFMNEMIG